MRLCPFGHGACISKIEPCPFIPKKWTDYQGFLDQGGATNDNCDSFKTFPNAKELARLNRQAQKGGNLT